MLYWGTYELLLASYNKINYYIFNKTNQKYILLQKRFIKKVIIAAMLCIQYSCNDCGVGPGNLPPPPPLPDDVALYVSMDGEVAGLWILNANSLELVDRLITKPGVPWTVEFSPDENMWYSSWGQGPDYNIYSGDVHPLTIRNSIGLLYSKYAITSNVDQSYLIAYGYKGIDIFDQSTLALVKSDTSLGEYSRIACSKKANKLYFTHWPTDDQLAGFGVYDLELMKVTNVINVFDNEEYPGLQDADLIVSPDDNLLFFSAWNWRGGGGFNTFFVIDITQKKIVGEFSCGPFAQLAVSPDGNSVYLSNPAGYLHNFPSRHKMLKYNVITNTMHNFLNLGGTDRIVVAEDNRTVFVSAFPQFQLPDGQWVSVIKVDALSGNIIGSYAIPFDSLSRLTTHPRNIRLGKYPTTILKVKKGGGNLNRK